MYYNIVCVYKDYNLFVQLVIILKSSTISTTFSIKLCRLDFFFLRLVPGQLRQSHCHRLTVTRRPSSWCVGAGHHAISAMEARHCSQCRAASIAYSTIVQVETLELSARAGVNTMTDAGTWRMQDGQPCGCAVSDLKTFFRQV